MNKLTEFTESVIELYSTHNKIDRDKSYLLFRDVYKYYNSKKGERLQSNPMLSLEKQWYDSLDKNIIDYTVYDDDYYFVDLMACYWIYSKNYIKDLNKNVFDGKTKSITDKFSDISSIMDLGCGLGYTTNDLQNLYPNAKVYGTNIKNTPQWFHCLEVLQDNIVLLSEDLLPSHHIDMVFASEFFEHIERPIEYVTSIISRNTPNILVLANSFNTKSIGHFYDYKDEDTVISQKNISKEFNNRLRKFGYVKQVTSIWNNKPSIWVKNEK